MPKPASTVLHLSIEVIEGADKGKVCAVGTGVLVGTSELSDFQLSDRAVSRRHVEIRPSAIGAEVHDAGSRNGTWFGGLRIFRVELALGCTLRIGSTVLRIMEAESESTPGPVTRTHFGRFLGTSPALDRVYRHLDAALGSDATVLLEGESGTGKELLSEAVHEDGARKQGPFVIVDCGSIPASLIESELFGHVHGASTGAHGDRKGAFEQAHGGTLVLDEIGELPLVMQTRLLRVLDQGRIRRVGAEAAIAVDVRVIAATNRNLEKEVEEGRFRLDLFHRLAVIFVRVPPLRERLDDLEPLARSFLQGFGADPSVLTPLLLERLRAHSWPGNVRELRNHIERLTLLGELALTPREGPLPDGIESIATLGLPFRRARALAMVRFTESYVEDMLKRHEGNVSRAAIAAGVARRHFQRMKNPPKDE